MKIKIIYIGKNKHDYIDQAEKEYLKMLNKYCDLEIVVLKDEKSLEKNIEKLSKTQEAVVVLDEKGLEMSSIEFSRFISTQKIVGKLTFIIGGPDGLSQSVKNKANNLISVSRMTFTHQFVRLILLEQIYRAFEIEKGSQYHK